MVGECLDNELSYHWRIVEYLFMQTRVILKVMSVYTRTMCNDVSTVFCMVACIVK